MKTVLSPKALAAKNPKADESEIRKALKIFASIGHKTGPRVAAYPTKRLQPAQPTGADDPRRVRLSESR